MSQRMKLTAVIITYNEEQKIARCLRSLAWVDEIVVVDSFSTDKTMEICRRYTDKVYQHPWPNSSSQQRTIADRYASHDWILALDADEVITKALRDEILSVLSVVSRVNAFWIPRREYFSGKWIEAGGWYPQWKTILYRKSMGGWSGPIHLRFITRGMVQKLKNPILHDGYASFRVFMDKFNCYSSIEADADVSVHKRKFSLARAFFKPLERFIGRFFIHRGYKDGIHGLYMASVIAINYFLREFKIYELHYRNRKKEEWDAVYKNAAVGVDVDSDMK
jgi:glycosyltransferase involved in cell wall biosynthesis